MCLSSCGLYLLPIIHKDHSSISYDRHPWSCAAPCINRLYCQLFDTEDVNLSVWRYRVLQNGLLVCRSWVR